MTTNTMKAITQKKYGAPDVLELREIEKPEFGADEVLVRVRAAGVDRGVWHLMMGLPYLVRFFGYGLRSPKNTVPGMDVSGIIEAVGENVSRFRPGDEVFGIGVGTFAEYARAREDKLARKPANLTFEEAAALAVSGLTALQGLRDHGCIEAGKRVLITGASGGVGTFAVQIAKAFGGHVTGVCHSGKSEMVLSIGADEVIAYDRAEFTKAGRRYDLILDIAGNSSLSRLRRALTPRGTLVLVGGEEGGRLFGIVTRLLRATILSPFVSHEIRVFVSSENHEDMEVLGKLVEAGKLMPVVDRTFPLSETPEAVRHLEDRSVRGKVVIVV